MQRSVPFGQQKRHILLNEVSNCKGGGVWYQHAAQRMRWRQFLYGLEEMSQTINCFACEFPLRVCTGSDRTDDDAAGRMFEIYEGFAACAIVWDALQRYVANPIKHANEILR